MTDRCARCGSDQHDKAGFGGIAGTRLIKSIVLHDGSVLLVVCPAFVPSKSSGVSPSDTKP